MQNLDLYIKEYNPRINKREKKEKRTYLIFLKYIAQNNTVQTIRQIG